MYVGDANGDGKADLVYGRPLGMTSLITTLDLTLVRWFGRSSLGSSFSSFTTWADDAGNEGDCFPYGCWFVAPPGGQTFGCCCR
jgi:hypothetical protein